MSQDVIGLLMLLGIAVLLVAIASQGLVAWAREEWRLIRAHTWQGTYLVNPQLGSVSTSDRVAAMVVRQRCYARRLRREGRTLLCAGKEYVPVLTKPQPIEKPPKADKVVPIRRPVLAITKETKR